MTNHDIMTSRNYNPQTLRIEYPASFLETMPIKQVTAEEMHELMCEMDYNPIHFYPQGVVLHNNERGHDTSYRYVIAENL